MGILPKKKKKGFPSMRWHNLWQYVSKKKKIFDNMPLCEFDVMQINVWLGYGSSNNFLI